MNQSNDLDITSKNPKILLNENIKNNSENQSDIFLNNLDL